MRRVLPALAVMAIVTGLAVAFWPRTPMPHLLPTPTASPLPTHTSTPPSTPTPAGIDIESLLPRPRGLRDTTRLLADRVGPRLRKRFADAGVSYPPKRAALLAFKAERRLELWSLRDSGNQIVHSYAIQGASGGRGPKLREGDWQVPEGIYRLAGLNPNSRFHLSLKIDYPNTFDHRMARADGRTKLGGDIFIHGGAASIGCLAIGNWAAEEVFLLAVDVGYRNVDVIIAPFDFRSGQAPDAAPVGLWSDPPWLDSLYGEIYAALAPFAR